ncbi:MAG TPA: hypothetical protein VMA77_25635 [Solirubrobacteraceae bacterium]|nr:hypothetical protein [Solirubrobacteraceae bacterium]
MPSLVRVTLGIATYNGDTYLADGREPGTRALADPLAAVPAASPMGLL